MFGAVMKAIRPRQWTKNGIVFVALVFSEQFRDLQSVGLSFAALGILSAASSAGYLFNDLRDVENDRAHPDKCKRPIASGALPVGAAWALMLVLLGGSLTGAWFMGPSFALAVAGYLVTTITYTLVFKHVVLLDVMFIAGLFIIRAVAGAEAIGVPSSPWFLITTLFLALFLGFAKRRAELTLLETGAVNHRKILQEYSPALLDQLMAVTASGAILAYAMYSFVAAKTPYLMVTVPIVMYGIFRYYYLVHLREQGGHPDATLLRDRGMWATVLLYTAAAVVILLFFTEPATGVLPGTASSP